MKSQKIQYQSSNSDLCRYQGPYVMNKDGLGTWHELPYVALLDLGIPLKLISLGKELFLTQTLSLSQKTSCADCHLEARAFTDGKALATNDQKKSLSRSTPSLANVIFQNRFFWDGRSPSLFDAVFEPLFAHDEMGLNPELLVMRIEKNPVFVASFEDIYASVELDTFLNLIPKSLAHDQATKISQKNMPKASFPPKKSFLTLEGDVKKDVVLKIVGASLFAYQATLLSLDSPFDRWFLKQDDATLSDQEISGYNVFRSFVTRCAECHIPPLFTSSQLVVIGSPNHPAKRGDLGAYHQNPHPHLKRAFKVPTLRNITLTAPYMHSGALPTLESLIQFYDLGLGRRLSQDSVPGLHWHIRALKLTAQEKKDLAVFLGTLTDFSFAHQIQGH